MMIINNFKRMVRKIINILYTYVSKPRMIMGYRCYDGAFQAHTRVASTTALVAESKLVIEDKVWIGHYCFIEASNGLFIGEGCQITNFISIITHSSHNSIRLYGKQYLKHTPNLIAYQTGAVKIGKYSFIGPHSLILPNTIIGKGSIIAAYSKVKGEFPDFAIIAGNPAKIVGDTRQIDSTYLQDNPELLDYYNEWAKEYDG